MRTGPKPLMTHLGLALSASAQHTDSDDDARVYAEKMLQGIRKYQLHPYKRPEPDRKIIWESGQVSLLAFEADEPKGSLFVVPSMVNRAYILDLMERQSFCAWFAKQGFNTYLLDWGDPQNDEGQANLETLFQARFLPALEACYKRAGQERLHVLGYCMGGTLSAALVQLRPDMIRSLCLLAAPWDFEAEGGDLSKWVKFWTPSGLSMIGQSGYLPSDWIQTVFASLDPFHTAQKFTDFCDMPEDGEKTEIFVAVEDWLNDAVALPGELAKECLQHWFIENRPYQGGWQVNGVAIDPAQISAPVLVVASENDRLVPFQSSMAFAEKAGAKIMRALCGHIGFMASQRALDEVWSQILKFYQAQL